MTRALDTPICELFGIRYPIMQTGMGWVSGARLTAATSAGGRPRHPRLGDDDAGRAGDGHPRGARADRRALRREPAHRPGDIDERVALLVREKVKVASFAQAPRKDDRPAPEGRRRAHDADGRREAARREGRRAGRRRHHRAGARGRRAHGPGADVAAPAAGGERGGHPRRSARGASSTGAGSSRRSPRARRASRWARASS